MRVRIYTSVHLRPNGTRHPHLVFCPRLRRAASPVSVHLRPYTRRRVSLAFFLQKRQKLYTPNYRAAGDLYTPNYRISEAEK